MKRVVVAVVGVSLIGSLTTACDTGPECVRGHNVMTMMPIYDGKTTTLQPVWTFVCDEYTKEPAQ